MNICDIKLIIIIIYLNLLDGFGCNGRVTEIKRSHVTNVNRYVDDWQLNVLRKPKYIHIKTQKFIIRVYSNFFNYNIMYLSIYLYLKRNYCMYLTYIISDTYTNTELVCKYMCNCVLYILKYLYINS